MLFNIFRKIFGINTQLIYEWLLRISLKNVYDGSFHQIHENPWNYLENQLKTKKQSTDFCRIYLQITLIDPLPSFYLLLQSLARHLKIRRREYIIYSTIYFSWSSQTVWYLVFWDNCCNSPDSRAWVVIDTGKRMRI